MLAPLLLLRGLLEHERRHGQKWSSTVEHGETWEMSVKIRSVEGVEAAVEVKVPDSRDAFTKHSLEGISG